jgi:hypothetical protein
MSTIELPENNNNLKKSRRSLLLVLAAFVLPIILAKFALEQQWLDTGVTNKGTLLASELTLGQLGLKSTDFQQKWLILYSLPEACDIKCQKTLEAVHNTYVALGKDMPRVSPVALYQTELPAQQSQKISESKWQLLVMPKQAKQYIAKPQVFIVDPLGNVFLSHQLPEKTEYLPQFGKQILADMKKLLKYSKVG